MSQYYINQFELNTSDLGAVGETRQISIKGDVGAEFYLQVIKDSINWDIDTCKPLNIFVDKRWPPLYVSCVRETFLYLVVSVIIPFI